MIQDANTFLNRTMTARTFPSALDPLSSSTLNKLHEAAPPSKKRKLEPGTAAEQLSTTSIVIRVRFALLETQTQPTLANTALFPRPMPLHYQMNRSSSNPLPHSPDLDSRFHGSKMHPCRSLMRSRVACSLRIYLPWKLTCALVRSRLSSRHGLLPVVGYM